jgi:hypothetical protein
MDAHTIIDQTMAKGEAEKLHDLTGKSPELYNSYRRAPRTDENPMGTGNFSPLHHYKNFYALRRAVNPEGALKMHELLNRDIQTELVCEGENPLKTIISGMNGILDTINCLRTEHVEDSDHNDLVLFDGLMEEMREKLDEVQSSVRAERRRRQVLKLQKAS